MFVGFVDVETFNTVVPEAFTTFKMPLFVEVPIETPDAVL